MISEALLSLYHIFKYNLIMHTIAHGALSFSIIKNFIACLISWSIAHQSFAFLIGASIFFVTNSKNKNEIPSGILFYFQNQTSNCINKEIGFTASSIYARKYPPENVASNGQNKYFLTKNLPESWILINFNDHKIIPTNYALKSAGYFEELQGSRHLKSWIIEGSNDNNKWELVDEQKNFEFLKKDGDFQIFDIDEEKSKQFKYLRLKQTGVNWEGDDYLAIDSIEIYGVLDFLRFVDKMKLFFKDIFNEADETTVHEFNHGPPFLRHT